MLNINGKNITEIRIGEKIITSIYHGIKLVWSSANSCFASDFEKIDEPKEEVNEKEIV